MDETKQKVVKSYDDMDLFEALAQEADQPLKKAMLVDSIIANVRDGDASAMKVLERALLSGQYKKEETLRITNEQFQRCITLAAERLARNSETAQAS